VKIRQEIRSLLEPDDDLDRTQEDWFDEDVTEEVDLAGDEPED
jgi:hypothetical protein